MKINWKVRLKSGSWWLGIISAIIVAVFAILNLFGIKTSVAVSDIMNAATLILMIPAAIGIISDPTTKGVGDSSQALTYEAPRTDETEGE